MNQVPTQGIANWVEKWSFVSLGEERRQITCIIKGISIIMIIQIVIFFQHIIVNISCAFTIFQDK